MSAHAVNIEDIWVPRRQLSLRQARQRSDLVRLLRMLFTTVAAISAGVMVGFLAYSALNGSRAVPIPPHENLVVMQNPRFTGRDKSGQPYVITADSATRNLSNPSLVELVNPAMEDVVSGTVRAPRGVFDQEAQRLELFENVVMTDNSGNRFVSTHARMNVQENKIVGLQPLEGDGPTGKIRADSYEIRDGGDIIIFTGNVWTELEPVRRDTGE